MAETLYKGLVGNAKSLVAHFPEENWMYAYALWLARESKPFTKKEVTKCEEIAKELSHWTKCQHHSGGSHMVLMQYIFDYLGARALSDAELAYMRENKEFGEDDSS